MLSLTDEIELKHEYTISFKTRAFDSSVPSLISNLTQVLCMLLQREIISRYNNLVRRDVK